MLIDEIETERILREIKQKRKKNYPLESVKTLIDKLEAKYEKAINQSPTKKELYQFPLYMEKNDLRGNEYWFCPEDEYYLPILNYVSKNDIVFDIGAGDLRFALMLSKKVKRVYAIEINSTILSESLHIIGYSKPKNLFIINGNGFQMEIPSEVNLITCLMIHKQHSPKFYKTHKIIQTTFGGFDLINFSKSEKKKFEKGIPNGNKDFYFEQSRER